VIYITLRKPIIAVLGHIDAGKTRLLDAIRGTAIIEKEAGGITQHIGATEVPIETIKNLSRDILQIYKFELRIPGLLFIDTPGHEAFSTLRERGSSIADLAVLVVDINKGCQEQTYEALSILKSFKVPFIIAANKIDTIFEWNSINSTSILKSMKSQDEKALKKLDEKIYILVGQLFQQGFNAERFDRVKDFTKEILIIPVSAKTKEGIAELLLFLAGLSQKYLGKKLEIHKDAFGKGTILEVKEEKGLGKTIDVILYDGRIKVNDRIAFYGKKGVVQTKVRALLVPKPLAELREEKKFKNIKEVTAAAGLKIAAPGLDEAIAGSPIIVVRDESQLKEFSKQLKDIKIERDVVGVIVKADTIGALEALISLLEKEGLKIRKADIGEITKQDLIESSNISKKDPYAGVIFAFNVKVDEKILNEAKALNTKIFSSNVIYTLLEDYKKWVEEKKREERMKILQSINYPAKFQVLRGCIFRNSKPAIVGIRVISGKLRPNVIVLREDGKELGKLLNIQSEGETINEAEKGSEVAISIDKAVVGRNLFEDDVLYIKLTKNDIKQLKKLWQELSEEDKNLIEEIISIQKG